MKKKKRVTTLSQQNREILKIEKKKNNTNLKFELWMLIWIGFWGYTEQNSNDYSVIYWNAKFSKKKALQQSLHIMVSPEAFRLLTPCSIFHLISFYKLF